MLNDYINSGEELDIGKLSQLSPEKFREMYMKEMATFYRNHGKAPNCGKCHNPVENPEDLIRYFGANLHVGCFLDEFGEERSKLRECEKRFFDLVSRINLGVNC